MEGLNMKKDLYKIIKEDLKKHCSNVEYFNREFFKEFCAAQKRRNEIYKNGVWNLEKLEKERYTDENGIIKLHYYDNIYKSDFYNKNSCAFCVFLEVAYNYEKLIAA